ncbi:hypothetical protein BO70DRAFT_356097 [Aspergillus heteromorphus CBS 117.55]|uniref:Uncharacterized protein n=1 Tax=Aspergillus heteromorphus CBS 117.55 TaxID=1448321 RepID=A0A317V768_9EURO|nr:uncharacterized protein BO70DRAFT_356097 [Aspergillus heteromorphus CBS 117.55]PWY68672.1 hypothetical protein BO70DRAFT_356097 [Aspergillus heteromorphus CBS 117.55]
METDAYPAPLTWLQCHVVKILEAAGVPSFLFGNEALMIYHFYSGPKSTELEWGIPDRFMGKATKALEEAGFKLHLAANNPEHGDPDYEFKCPPDIATRIENAPDVWLYHASRICWNFPDPPIGPLGVNGNAYYTVTSHTRFYSSTDVHVDRPITLYKRGADNVTRPTYDSERYLHPFSIDPWFSEQYETNPQFKEKYRARPYWYNRLGPNNPSLEEPPVYVKILRPEKWIEAAILRLVRNLTVTDREEYSDLTLSKVARKHLRRRIPPNLVLENLHDPFRTYMERLMQLADAEPDRTKELRDDVFLQRLYNVLRAKDQLPPHGDTAIARPDGAQPNLRGILEAARSGSHRARDDQYQYPDPDPLNLLPQDLLVELLNSPGIREKWAGRSH